MKKHDYFKNSLQDYNRTFVEASFGLWNTLIILNGFILGSILIIFMIRDDLALSPFIWTFFIGIGSIGLLFHNYYIFYKMYFQRGSKSNSVHISTTSKKMLDIKRKLHLSVIFLFLELIILFGMIVVNRFTIKVKGGQLMNFSELLTFFDSHAGAVQAIFSVFLFLATVIYVVTNSKMHREMVRERRRVEKPEINIRFEEIRGGVWYNIIIENISSTPAKDLIFVDYPRLKAHDNLYTDDIGFLKNGIKYLGPGQKYKSFFLDREIISDPMQTITFALEYKNDKEEEFLLNFEFNLSMFEHIYSLGGGKSFERELLEKLECLNKNIKNIRTSDNTE